MTRTMLITCGATLLYMTLCFVIAQLRGRNDIADVAWGIGFIVAAAVSLVVGGAFTARGLLVSSLVLVWGVRLALHIHTRDRGKAEDPRYRKWREQWGDAFLVRSYLQIFLLQGALLILVALPVIYLNQAPAAPLVWSDLLGVLLWFTGFYFEAAGDWQLLSFIREPRNRGRLLTTGLWRLSRHPNYFGEVTLWWGIWILTWPLPGWWFALLGPLTITVLILKVSGIPMLEERYRGRPDFEAYRRRTSAFFPWPPKPGA